MVGLAEVRQFVDDDVIQDELGHVLQSPGDADSTSRRGATAEPRMLVIDEADALPAQLAAEQAPV
jgi:hypothetical protein